MRTISGLTGYKVYSNRQGSLAFSYTFYLSNRTMRGSTAPALTQCLVCSILPYIRIQVNPPQRQQRRGLAGRPVCIVVWHGKNRQKIKKLTRVNVWRYIGKGLHPGAERVTQHLTNSQSLSQFHICIPVNLNTHPLFPKNKIASLFHYFPHVYWSTNYPTHPPSAATCPSKKT